MDPDLIPEEVQHLSILSRSVVSRCKDNLNSYSDNIRWNQIAILCNSYYAQEVDYELISSRDILYATSFVGTYMELTEMFGDIDINTILKHGQEMLGVRLLDRRFSSAWAQTCQFDVLLPPILFPTIISEAEEQLRYTLSMLIKHEDKDIFIHGLLEHLRICVTDIIVDWLIPYSISLHYITHLSSLDKDLLSDMIAKLYLEVNASYHNLLSIKHICAKAAVTADDDIPEISDNWEQEVADLATCDQPPLEVNDSAITTEAPIENFQ